MIQFIYRIWDIKEKKYIATFSLYNNEGVDTVSQHYNRKTHTIEEYTGVDDINGTRIFEGDIIKYTAKGNKTETRCVIKWQCHCWYFCEINGGSTPFTYLPKVEVIGNINQHSNLLN